MPSITQHFYPQTCETLYNELTKKSCSLNFIGEAGRGRSGVLMDLKQKLQSKKHPVALVHMREYVDSYAGFLNELYKQLKLRPQSAQGKSLVDLCRQLEERKSFTFLLLDDFDALMGNPDIAVEYQKQQFIDQIRSIKSTDVLHLICGSEKRLLNQTYYKEGKQLPNSPFRLEDETLPSHISTDGIRAALDEQLATTDYWQSIDEHLRAAYVGAIQNNQQSTYTYCRYIIGELNNRGKTEAQRETIYKVKNNLKDWERAFHQHHQDVWSKSISKRRTKLTRFLQNIGLLSKGIQLQPTTLAKGGLWAGVLALLGYLADFLGVFSFFFGG